MRVERLRKIADLRRKIEKPVKEEEEEEEEEIQKAPPKRGKSERRPKF